MNSFIRDLFSVLGSRFTVIICGILTSILTARYIGPAGNGIIAALIVYPDLFMTIGSMGIRQSTTYFVGSGKYNRDAIFSSVIYLCIITSIFCVGVCYVLIKYFTKVQYKELYILLAISPIPFSLFTTYASGMFLGMGNIKEFNRVNWVPNFIKLVGVGALVVFLGFGVEGVLIATFLGMFILSFLVVRVMSRLINIQFVFDKKLIGQLLKLGLGYAFAMLVVNLNYKADVVLLERFSTESQLGLYSKGVVIVEYLWEVPTLISTIVFSRSANAKDSKAFSEKVCSMLRIGSILVLAASLVFFVLSPVIIRVMYGEAFMPSSTVQKILIPGIFLMTIFKVLNMDLAGKGKPWVSMWAMIPALLINIALNIVFIPKYGANGSALASTISYSFAAVVFLFSYAKTTGIPVKRIFSYTRDDFDLIKGLLAKGKNVIARSKPA
ncbi:MAG: flippase [Mucilaginibacter polytrichastri]|nr:flippase [Mucilaginibacter polytrichastri]